MSRFGAAGVHRVLYTLQEGARARVSGSESRFTRPRSSPRGIPMIVDTLENWPKYFRGNDVWRQAFAYLTSLTADTEPGEMTSILDDRLRARVMRYSTMSPEQAVLEAHDKHVDIQMSLVNAECIDWFPRALLTPKTAYDTASDATFFERPDFAPVRVFNRPGAFTVLFPQDAHSPQLNPGQTPETVTKVVVKVLASALQY